MKIKKDKYKCFFCGKLFSAKGAREHFPYGEDEYPTCLQYPRRKENKDE